MGDRESISVVVAGVPRAVNLEKLRGYATNAGTSRTIDRCDLRDVPHPSRLSLEDVAATRSMKSRISSREADWFVERARTAPWSTVPATLDLADASVDEHQLVHARELFGHFIDHAPKGVAMGKVHKVLHLVRPNFFPILDSRLQRTYRPVARPQPDEYRSVVLWSAVRADLLDQETVAGIEQLRSWAADDLDPRVNRLQRLSDVRLLDICTWLGGST